MEKISNIVDQVANLNDETQIHSKRVGLYAKAFSIILGLNNEESNKIAIAAVTHDLGKMHIDKNVLEKPDKLTEEEFELIKKHPELGYQELIKNKSKLNQSPEQFRVTLEVALYHHEKYNGFGYPQQLKGEEIPLSAQIVGVVDVFDALSCERVYKRSWDKEELMDFMAEQSGKAFNPVLVNAFLKNQDIFYGLKDYIGSSNDLDITNMDSEVSNFMKRNGYDVVNKEKSLTYALIEKQRRKF